MTLKSRSNSLESSNFIILAIPVASAVTNSEDKGLNLAILLVSNLHSGHSCGCCLLLNPSLSDSSSSVSHVGPSIHKAHSDNSNDLIPQEGMSVGLIFR